MFSGELCDRCRIACFFKNGGRCSIMWPMIDDVLRDESLNQTKYHATLTRQDNKSKQSHVLNDH